MNELEFKRQIKDLVQGHHHPEEHDRQAGGFKPAEGPRRRTIKVKHLVGLAAVGLILVVCTLQFAAH